MNISINGEKNKAVSSLLADIVMHKKFKSPFAVAVNKIFVPKHLYQTTYLQEGDAVDVVSPIQGG